MERKNALLTHFLVYLFFSLTVIGVNYVVEVSEVVTGWENEGIYGGRINCIIIDPNSYDPDINQCTTLLIGTQEGDKLFKSTDAGQTWQKIGPVVETADGEKLRFDIIWAMVTDPNNPNIVYVADHSLKKTTDWGSSWISPTMDPPDAMHLAIDPKNSSIIYTIGREKESSFEIYKSVDGGNNWVQLSVIEAPGAFPCDIMVHPNDSNVIFVALGLERGVWPPWPLKGGLFKSYDSGHSWKLVLGNQSGDFGVSKIAYSPINNAFYAATTHGIYKSVDDGDSWSLLEDFNGTRERESTRCVLSIAVGSQGVIYAGGYWGIYKSNVSSDSEWVQTGFNPSLSLFKDMPGECRCTFIAIDPVNPQVIYACSWDFLFKSSDGGQTWQSITEGITAVRIFDIEKVGEVFYACGEPGLYKKLGNGSWQMIRSEGFTDLAVDPVNLERIAASMPARSVLIEISEDGGESWQRIDICWSQDLDTSLHGFSIILYSNMIYLAVGVLGGIDGGVLKITKIDNGSYSWEIVSENYFPHKPVYVLAMDPKNSSILYAGLGYPWYVESTGGVWKTLDGGRTWQNISSGLPNKCVNSIVIDPSAPQTIYVAIEREIYKSMDGGGSWEKIGEFEGPVSSLALDPNNTEIIYACVCSGQSVIFKSTNGGYSWLEYSTIDYKVYDMVVGSLYVATDGGLWRYTYTGYTGEETALTGASPEAVDRWFIVLSVMVSTVFGSIVYLVAIRRYKRYRTLKMKPKM